MVKTSIEVDSEVKSKLARLKLNLNAKSYNEVIEKLIKLLSKYKLNKELEAVK